jgi:hypothetical protein
MKVAVFELSGLFFVVGGAFLFKSSPDADSMILGAVLFGTGAIINEIRKLKK